MRRDAQHSEANFVTMGLPFALQNGRVVDISSVESGLHRDCLCPVCGSALVAKKGLQVQHHFAHHVESNCLHAGETLLHLASKQLIDEAKSIRLPAVLLEFTSYKKPWVIAEEANIDIDEVLVEKRVGEDIPDLILSVKDRRLAIEVTVTHKTSHDKIRRLSGQGCSILEIDMSKHSRFLTLQELRSEVIESVACKRWLFNHKPKRVLDDLYRSSKPKAHVHRGLALHVDDCPLPAREWRGKPYANVIDDCLNCRFCLDGGLSHKGRRGVIYCLGHERLETYEQWKGRHLTCR